MRVFLHVFVIVLACFMVFIHINVVTRRKATYVFVDNLAYCGNDHTLCKCSIPSYQQVGQVELEDQEKLSRFSRKTM